ncbi:MAG: protein-tyrosine phosphatase family protein [Parachlamydiales bacterium]|jgi:hypothetical protein
MSFPPVKDYKNFPNFYDAAKNTIATGEDSAFKMGKGNTIVARKYLTEGNKHLDSQPEHRRINVATTRAAVEIIHESGEYLKSHPGDLKAMKQLLRAYDFLRTQEDRIINKKRSIVRNIYTRIWGSVNEYKNNIQFAEKAMLGQFNTYLKAHSSLSETPSIEKRLKDHIMDIEYNLDAFGVKKTNWNKVKEHIIHNQPNQAEVVWKTILEDVSKKAGKLNLSGPEEIEKYLLGSIPIKKLIKSKGPEFARFCARYDELENISLQSPSLRKLWIKSQVFAIKGDNKNFEKSIMKFCKEAKNDEISNYFFVKPKLVDNEVKNALRQGDYNVVFSNLTINNNDFFNRIDAHAMQLGQPDRSHLGKLNLQTVALGKNNYIASAAPKNDRQVEAYFDALEAGDTSIIVDLKGDFETKMQRFSLLPEKEGEKKIFGETTVKLIKNRTYDVVGAWENVASINRIRIEVTRPDGSTKEYRIFRLNNWEENSPPDLVALRTLDKNVRDVMGKKYGSNVAVQCADGYTRTATFLMYHHLQNEPKARPLGTYLEYRRLRPTIPPLSSSATERQTQRQQILAKQQLASLCAAQFEEMNSLRRNAPPLSHPNATIESPQNLMNSTLYNTHHAALIIKYIKHNPGIHDSLVKLHSPNNTEVTAEFLYKKFLSAKLNTFLDGLPENTKHELQIKFKHLKEDDLNILFFFLYKGLTAKDIIQRVSPQSFINLLTSESKDQLFSYFHEFNNTSIHPIEAFMQNTKVESRYQSPIHTLLQSTDAILQKGDLTRKEGEVLQQLKQHYLMQFRGEMHQNMENDELNFYDAIASKYEIFNEDLDHLSVLALPSEVIQYVHPDFFKEHGVRLLEDLTEAQIKALNQEQITALLVAAAGGKTFHYLKKLPYEIFIKELDHLSVLAPPSEALNYVHADFFKEYGDRLLEDLTEAQIKALNQEHITALLVAAKGGEKTFHYIKKLPLEVVKRLTPNLVSIELFKEMNPSQLLAYYQGNPITDYKDPLAHAALVHLQGLKPQNELDKIACRDAIKLITNSISDLETNEIQSILSQLSAITTVVERTLNLVKDTDKERIRNPLINVFHDKLTLLEEKINSLDWMVKVITSRDINDAKKILEKVFFLRKDYQENADLKIISTILTKILSKTDEIWEFIDYDQWEYIERPNDTETK